MHKCTLGRIRSDLRCESVVVKCKMASFKDEGAKVVDKFNGENISLWKFKMEIVLASMDL